MADALNYTELDWRWAILLGVAVRDGLLEAVAVRPREPEDAAAELGLDTRAVYVVLSALSELGVLEEGEDGFGLRDEHRVPLLGRDDPDYVGGSVVHRFELICGWSRMGEILRTGEPVEDRTSPDFGGVPLEHVQKARAAVAGNASPSKAAGREWELSGGTARCRVCGSTMRTRTRARNNGGEPLLYYVCSKSRNDEGPHPCAAKKNHRAEALETEVVTLMDEELLADRETLERWIERGLDRATGASGARAGTGRDAAASACARALEEVARERERLVRLYTTGRLGLYYFPAHLRRQVYGALGLTAFVSPDGTVEIEGSFDAEVIRLTREVEEYALALKEAEGRIDGYEAASTEDGWEQLERELSRVRDEQTPRLSRGRGLA